MPIKKASFKSLRQSKKRRARNLRVKKPLMSAIKNAQKLIQNKKIEEAKINVLKTIKLLDRAAAKGIIKKNTAARKKSRLMKKLNLLLSK